LRLTKRREQLITSKQEHAATIAVASNFRGHVMQPNVQVELLAKVGLALIRDCNVVRPTDIDG
jgi:hypothetical protein